MFDEFALSNLFPKINTMVISSIEFLVLLLLMMLVMNTLMISGLLTVMGQKLASFTKTERRLAFSLCIFVFMSSAFLTNDVVLLGVVPLTIIIGVSSRIQVVKLIIFEGIAANAGSLLTPFGNPQNIYISVHYRISFADFIKAMMPLWLISLALLAAIVLLCFTDKELHKIHVRRHHDKIATLGLAALFIIILYFCIGLPIVIIAPAVIVLLLATGKIKRIMHMFDWKLFLLFVGIAVITTILLAIWTLYIVGIPLLFFAVGLSQAISNVPAAFLLSGTVDWKMLALGVNIGGSGTLISSIATVIAFRYAKRYDLKTKAIDFMKWGILFCVVQLIAILSVIHFVKI